jgi:hypothetical protein
LFNTSCLPNRQRWLPQCRHALPHQPESFLIGKLAPGKPALPETSKEL